MAGRALDSGDWWRATTMRERIELVRGERLQGAPLDPQADARGRQELDRWREYAPFDRREWLDRRLDAASPDRGEVLAGLGAAGPPSGKSGSLPAWVETLASATRGATGANVLPMPERLQEMAERELMALVEPLATAAMDALGEDLLRATRGRDLPYDPRTLPSLAFPSVAWPLLDQIVRVLVLELNVARIENRLGGATPEERFADFCRSLRREDRARALFAEYPVMARRLVEKLDTWRSTTRELALRLADDWPAIVESFEGARSAGMLTSLELGAGDTHRGGRSVAVLSFAKGFRLVYKPRSMAIDAHFQEILRWLEARGGRALPRPIVVLARPTHGWTEFVDHAACPDRGALSRFYRRQGGLLALLYALEASDLHYENLIAAGEHPIPIDLESLFHPLRVREERMAADSEMVTTAVEGSVLRVGLLPQRALVSDAYTGIDLSGLGAVPGQVTPEVLQWTGQGTDAMHAEARRMLMPEGSHLPKLVAGDASILDFQEEIEGGFTEIYRLLLAHRDDLLADGGPIARCADDEIRFVLRPTHVYGRLLHDSLHPDFQRDMLDVERYFDRLWLGAVDSRAMERTSAFEVEDLLAGDVPAFTTRVGARDLWTSGGVRLTGFFRGSGLSAVRERLRGMSEEDLRRQIWFVGIALATVRLTEDKLRWPSYPPPPLPEVVDRDDLAARWIAESERIASRLLELALETEQAVGWLALAYSNREWSLVSLLDDLYAGGHGIVLYLAYHDSLRHDEATARCAHRALLTVLDRETAGASELTSIGAFNGLGSALYTLSHVGALWGDEGLLNRAEQAAHRIHALIDRDRDLDVVGGSAGAIAALLSLHAVRPRSDALAIATACGEKLLGAACPAGAGIGWMTRIETEEPITGFSHGAAGIGWSLIRLADATGDERFRRAGLDAFRYEYGLFSPEKREWVNTSATTARDRPVSAEALGLSVAWCYGAPGIGISRLVAAGEPEAPFVDVELRAAIEATLELGFGRNHCLCHGDLGNLDFLLLAAQRLRDGRLRRHVDRIGAAVLDSMGSHGWLCGVPLGVASPALMNGLAGIGLGLLRLAAPDRVPSVLALEEPRGVRGT